jgi:ABC-type tungstate transport system permease subunit
MSVFTALTKDTGLLEEVVETLNEYPDYELWVTGQSLGAALASLAAGKLVKDMGVNEENLKLVTIGQPRTGDTEWAEEMDRLV